VPAALDLAEARDVDSRDLRRDGFERPPAFPPHSPHHERHSCTLTRVDEERLIAALEDETSRIRAVIREGRPAGDEDALKSFEGGYLAGLQFALHAIRDEPDPVPEQN
jgi:hypothetical protein